MRHAFLAAILLAAAAPALAQTTPPSGWTCQPTYYGADDGCDCGCGAQDADCADTALATCEFNGCATDGQVPTSANSTVCAANTCGDGVADGAEVCDDGGAAGCNADCSAVEDGYACGDSLFGPFKGCHAVVCGDGTIDGDEECEDDDGASPQSGDGCSATCTVEDGFACGEPGTACVAVPAGWNCNAGYYGGGDGCDCGCGEPDPDCAGAGCADPGCTDDACLFCYDASGAMASCGGEGEGEGEGEDPPVGEGEGEGEGEGDGGGHSDDGDPNRDPPACASTAVSSGAPPALGLLVGLGFVMRRRR